MVDVLIAGAGPAGSVAALVLARAGARVVVVDRCDFPRDVVCGDVVGPRAVALARSLGLSGGVLDGAPRLAGTIVWRGRRSATREAGIGQESVAISRRHFDAWLLESAIAAGAKFEARQRVRAPLEERLSTPGTLMRGAVLAGRGLPVRMPALLTIAADGRRSVLARLSGLHPSNPVRRRCAISFHADGIAGLEDRIELHLGRHAWVGVTPLARSAARIWVYPVADGARPLSDACGHETLRAVGLAARLAGADVGSRRRAIVTTSWGAPAAGVPGLLLAGDAAGSRSPLDTTEGIADAMLGGLLAAQEALETLRSGDFAGSPDRLAMARRAALGASSLRTSILNGRTGLALASWGLWTHRAAALHLILGRPRL